MDCSRESSFIDLTTLSQRVSVCKRTIRTWIVEQSDPLPAYRLGGKLLFRWEEVLAWIERRRIVAPDFNDCIADLLGEDVR